MHKRNAGSGLLSGVGSAPAQGHATTWRAMIFRAMASASVWYISSPFASKRPLAAAQSPQRREVTVFMIYGRASQPLFSNQSTKLMIRMPSWSVSRYRVLARCLGLSCFKNALQPSKEKICACAKPLLHSCRQGVSHNHGLLAVVPGIKGFLWRRLQESH